MTTDLLEDIIAYFVEQGLCEGDGIDAFRDYEPDAPDTAIILNEYAGLGARMFEETVHRSVQFLARSNSATEAKNKARQMYDAMYSNNHFLTLTEERWCQAYLRQPPYKMRVDKAGRSYYGFNVGITSYVDKGGM